MSYRFGGLIFGGAYTWRGLFSEFYGTSNIDNQLKNSFLYNTFSVGEEHTGNPPDSARTLNRCYLEFGNGNEYPGIHYKPNDDLLRVYRDVMSYVYANNDFQGGALNTSKFKTLFPFVYFDLTTKNGDQRWSYRTGVSLRTIRQHTTR